MELESVFWVGLDWGTASHAVHAYRPGDARHCKFAVPHTPQGLRELAARLRELGEVGGVALETTHGLVVRGLLDGGFPVYPVNPKVSKAWRASCGAAAAKSDGGDARVLAEGLWQHRGELRPVRHGEDKTRQLARLVEAEKRFIDDRTALVQRLVDLLRRYHPQMLAFFKDWTSPVAWQFLAAFPTPGSLAGATKRRLCAFLRARHVGLGPLWQQRIEQRGAALDWPRDEALEEAHALQAGTLVRLLATLQTQLDVYRKMVGDLFAGTKGAGLLESLPGAGPKLAPRLCAMLCDCADQQGGADLLCKLSGVAPVTHQSGKKRDVRIRRACRDFWRDTMHLFAHFSKRGCAWAKAYYAMCRAGGDTNATALRKLGYKWAGIISRMWKDKKPYNEEIHIQSLRRSNSPTYQYMIKNGYLAQ